MSSPAFGPASGSAQWFATTHWSVVMAAKQSDSSEAAAALEKLCRAYWYSLYAFLRRQGKAAEDDHLLANPATVYSNLINFRKK